MMRLWKGATVVLAFIVLVSGCTGTSVNHPPVIKGWEPKGDPVLAEESLTTFRLSASDPDGTKLTCRWYLDGVLNSMAKAPFEFAYGPGRATGNHTLQAVVSDGSLTAAHLWRLQVYKVNHPPTVAGLAPAGREPPVNEGEPLDFRAEVSDPDGDPVTLTWQLDGKQVAQGEPAYRFQPGFDMAGVHVIRLNASDGRSSTEIAWNVTVVNVNRAPRIVSSSPPGEPHVLELDMQQFQAQAEDDDGDPLTYAWSVDGEHVGGGVSYNYTPDCYSQGNHTVTVAISDGSLEVRHSWRMLVDNLNRPPQIGSFSPGGNASTTEYEPLRFEIEGSDIDMDPLQVSWFVDNATSPAVMGTVFNYTPGYDSAGDHTVRVVLSDGNATVSQGWNVSVRRAVADWTVLVYMNADNDLEPYLIEDFNEMESVGSTQNVSIIVQMDRHPSYDASNGDWTEARRYRVEKDNDGQMIDSRLLMGLGEVDSGAPATLREFLLWGMEKFPAERYQVVMSGHGEGWTGISQDFSNSNDKMSLASVASALGPFVAARRAPVEVLELDVCYWAMLETDWGLRDLASYIVASEEIDPSPGQSYDLYLRNLTARPKMTARELAQETVSAFYRGYTVGKFWPGDNETFTQSAVDTSKLAAVAARLDAVSRLLAENLTSFLPGITAARQAAESYGKPEYIDLYDLVRLLRQGSTSDGLNASADTLLEAIRQAVISEVHGPERSDSHGISIYFPAFSYSYKASYTDLDMSRENHWCKLLMAYYNATGRGAAEGGAGAASVAAPPQGEPAGRGPSLSIGSNIADISTVKGGS